MSFTLKTISIFLFLAYLSLFTSAKNDISPGVHLFKCKNAGALNDTLELPPNLTLSKKTQQFKLLRSEHELPCDSSQRVLYIVPWNNSKIPYGDLSEIDNYIRIGISPDGILKVTNRSASQEDEPTYFTTYHFQKDFCIQGIRTDNEDNNKTLYLEVCSMQNKCPKTVVGKSPPCIRKCCYRMYETLAFKEDGNTQCVIPSFDPDRNHSMKGKPFQFEFIEKEFNGYHHKATHLQPKYFSDMYTYGEGECIIHTLKLPVNVYSGEYYSDMELSVFHLEDDGTLSLCERGKWMKFGPENFCIDAMQNFGSYDGESGNVMSLVFMRCDKIEPSSIMAEEPPAKETREILRKIALSIACFFLFITCLVYVLLWDKQNVQGYTIFFYIISLFFFYLFFAIGVSMYESIGTRICKFVAIAEHFSFISTFSWLTTVGFNIWWTFKEVKMPTKTDYLKKIVKYAIFSWSIPLVVVSVGLIIDSIDSQNEFVCSVTPVFRPLSPKYGQRSCTVIEEAQGVYMYFIGGVLLGCNLVFYCLTVCKLHQYRKETSRICRKEDGDQSVFFLYGKLFIVLGVCWIFEFLGWSVMNQNPNADESVSWFIFSMDIALVLQAIALFLIFVCKRTIFDQLWEKYPKLRSFLSLFAVCGCRYDVLPNERDSKISLTSKVNRTSHPAYISTDNGY